jgi:hypothetical protein
MAHIAGQQVAYTINEIEHGGDARWLKEQFALRHRHRIETHIRFGDYWYTSNSQLKELKEFTTELADARGLQMTPEKAWDWIARGGFIDEDLAVGIGGFDLASLKESRHYLADLKFDSPLEKNNVFRLDLKGAMSKDRASYLDGRVGKTLCYLRAGRVLPIRGAFELLVSVLQHETALERIIGAISMLAQQRADDRNFVQNVLPQVAPALEGMVADGWVHASYDPRRPLATLDSRFAGFHPHRDPK